MHNTTIYYDALQQRVDIFKLASVDTFRSLGPELQAAIGKYRLIDHSSSITSALISCQPKNIEKVMQELSEDEFLLDLYYAVFSSTTALPYIYVRDVVKTVYFEPILATLTPDILKSLQSSGIVVKEYYPSTTLSAALIIENTVTYNE